MGRIASPRYSRSGSPRAGRVRAYLAEHGTKTLESPVWVYQTCADIFDAVGDPDRARAAADDGYRELMERAGKISDPEWRRSYLENVAEHRAVVEMWEELNRQGEPLSPSPSA